MSTGQWVGLLLFVGRIRNYVRIIRGSGCALGDDHSSICAVGPRVMGGIWDGVYGVRVDMVYGYG